MSDLIQAANCTCTSGIILNSEKPRRKVELPLQCRTIFKSDILYETLIILTINSDTGRATNGGVRPLFCPFCGRKYKTPEEIIEAHKAKGESP